MPLVAVHSVLYHTPVAALERAIAALHGCAEFAASRGILRIELRWGDCSPVPVVSEERLATWRDRYPAFSAIETDFFGRNLGHGGAQNRLAEATDADFIVFSNPDIVAAGDAVYRLWIPFEDPAVGIVEGKQLPLEHPKDYDALTGATSWASGAFSMIRRSLFREVGGFDHESFFLHGDDVDLSWRVRALGYKVVANPAAIGFHDKRIGLDGALVVPDSERYHSAESALMLAWKWSRDDVLEGLWEAMSGSPDRFAKRAVAAFEKRRRAGELPERLDPGNTTAEFTEGTYGRHRW